MRFEFSFIQRRIVFLKIFFMMENEAPKNYLFAIPPWITKTGKMLEMISPALSAHFAFYIFYSPLKFRRPEREKEMYDAFSKKYIHIDEIGKKVKLYSSTSGNKDKALLVHGWSGRGTQLYAIAGALLKAGYEVYAFDAPAHGESPGRQTSMLEFIDVILELQEKIGAFDYAIGHSLGAMSIWAALNRGLNVKKAVVIGGGDSIEKITYRFVERLGLSPKTAEALYKKMAAKFGAEPEKLSSSVNAKRVQIPVMLIHDEEDTDVPLFCAEHVVKNANDIIFIKTKGLGHRRVLQDEKIVRKIIEFIDE